VAGLMRRQELSKMMERGDDEGYRCLLAALLPTPTFGNKIGSSVSFLFFFFFPIHRAGTFSCSVMAG
jgi:hypothetical protein